MTPVISPEEAARALAAIEGSQASMRASLRARRGHLHLWLWGAIWIVMALSAEIGGDATARFFPILATAGGVGSFLIGRAQNQAIRIPLDRRFLWVMSATLLFGPTWIMTTSGFTGPKAIFAFGGLLVAQIYVIAGIWFDTYLLRLGLVIAAAMLIGLLLLPAYFWIWVAIAGGGPLIGTGIYVRYFMR